jgi:hypothetical protein
LLLVDFQDLFLRLHSDCFCVVKINITRNQPIKKARRTGLVIFVIF